MITLLPCSGDQSVLLIGAFAPFIAVVAHTPEAIKASAHFSPSTTTTSAASFRIKENCNNHVHRHFNIFRIHGAGCVVFETQAHLFISEEGDVSARFRQENDFLITQRLIIEPYAEINLFAQDVPDRGIGAGISDGKIGLQTRYEITRKFAPYVDVHYGRKFGETSSIAKQNGEDKDAFAGAIGLRLMF